jgi:hypothetical protein
VVDIELASRATHPRIAQVRIDRRGTGSLKWERYAGKDLFIVGEYWTYDLKTLGWYAGNTAGRMCMFDAPLHNNFHRASRASGNFDMRTILDGTLP